MYRNRSRSKKNEDDGVKGPSSALTQFLRDQGISAQAIKDRWKQQQKGEEEEQQKESEPNAAQDEATIQSLKSETDDTEQTALLGDSDSNTETDDDLPFDRRIKVDQDSDEEEYGSDETSVKKRASIKTTLADKKRQSQVLQNRRKKRKRAADLLDRKLDRIPTLQDLCIKRISGNIYDLQKGNEKNEDTFFSQIRDVLGGISTDNLNNLGKALSKNRALNDSTLQLFLKTDLNDLTFYDCSKLSFEGYKSLAIFCPHLTKVSLQMCGQLNNEALLYMSEKLTNLSAVHLDGPFLINSDTWDKFFRNMKGRLTEFHISNTHRFTDRSLSSLLINCGSDLLSLKFSRLDSVFNYALLPQYINNDQLHTLAIEYPFNEGDVTDEVIINILGQIGSNIKALILNGCSDLTDSMVINGMTSFLADNRSLTVLELEELNSISTDSLMYFFNAVPLPNLKHCSLKRCSQIGDMAVIELLLNDAKESLEYLNLNSIKALTKESILMMSCPKLTHLDVSFVRCVDDGVVEKVGSQNPSLKLMEVFGDNLITRKAKLSLGLTLTGRESDTI